MAQFRCLVPVEHWLADCLSSLSVVLVYLLGVSTVEGASPIVKVGRPPVYAHQNMTENFASLLPLRAVGQIIAPIGARKHHFAGLVQP